MVGDGVEDGGIFDAKFRAGDDGTHFRMQEVRCGEEYVVERKVLGARHFHEPLRFEVLSQIVHQGGTTGYLGIDTVSACKIYRHRLDAENMFDTLGRHVICQPV
jgi:hypothetical protein